MGHIDDKKEGVGGAGEVFAQATWTFSGIYMTNINGGILSGGTSVVDNMWAYNTTNAYFIVGWSVSYGITWGEISNQLASGELGLSNYGYYGVSQVGFGMPGGGSPSLPVFHLFGGASAQGTGVSGFTLYPNVPEPGTLALTGLGGLSLCLFRRRKKQSRLTPAAKFSGASTPCRIWVCLSCAPAAHFRPASRFH